MKDYRISEVKEICKAHYKTKDSCLKCPLKNKSYAFERCSFYNSPYHWVNVEKDKGNNNET